MIEYEFVQGRKDWHINVRLNKKVVGRIKRNGDGFAYFPKGARKGVAGEIFKTVDEVKRSLEGE